MHFEDDVLKRSFKKPVLVDFWAPWCGPCRALTPVLEELVQDSGDRFELVKINTEEHQDVALKFRIQSIPAVKLFVDGVEVAEFLGALPKLKIIAFLDEHIPSQAKRLLGEALALWPEDRDAARLKLEAVVLAEPDHSEAKSYLARALMFKDKARALTLAQSVPDTHEGFALAEAVTQLLELHARRDSFDSSPDYQVAIDAWFSKEAEDALEGFVKTVALNRALDDDGARRAMVSIFKILGDDDPLVSEYRRRMTSALF